MKNKIYKKKKKKISIKPLWSLCNVRFTVISFSFSRRVGISSSVLTKIEVVKRINRKVALQCNKYDWYDTRKEHFLAMTSHKNAIPPLVMISVQIL